MRFGHAVPGREKRVADYRRTVASYKKNTKRGGMGKGRLTFRGIMLLLRKNDGGGSVISG